MRPLVYVETLPSIGGAPAKRFFAEQIEYSILLFGKGRPLAPKFDHVMLSLVNEVDNCRVDVFVERKRSGTTYFCSLRDVRRPRRDVDVLPISTMTCCRINALTKLMNVSLFIQIIYEMPEGTAIIIISK